MTTAIVAARQQLQSLIDSLNGLEECWLDVRRKLVAFDESGAWQTLQYPTCMDCIVSVWQRDRSRVYRLLREGYTARYLEEAGEDPSMFRADALYELGELKEPKQVVEAAKVARKEASRRPENGYVSGKVAKVAVKRVTTLEPVANTPKFSKDTPGKVIPDHLKDVFEVKAKVRTIVSQVRDAHSALMTLMQEPGGDWLELEKEKSLWMLSSFIKELRASWPHAVCTDCDGQPPFCANCGRKGWMIENVYRQG